MCPVFQLVEGLRYAFPNAMRRFELDFPQTAQVHRMVRDLPAVAAYVASDRRVPFSENAFSRHYPELGRRGRRGRVSAAVASGRFFHTASPSGSRRFPAGTNHNSCRPSLPCPRRRRCRTRRQWRRGLRRRRRPCRRRSMARSRAIGPAAGQQGAAVRNFNRFVREQLHQPVPGGEQVVAAGEHAGCQPPVLHLGSAEDPRPPGPAATSSHPGRRGRRPLPHAHPPRRRGRRVRGARPGPPAG